MAIDHDELVHAEQVKIMYSQTMTGVLGGPVASLIAAWIFRNVVEQEILVVWLTCTILVAAMRVYPYIVFSRRKHDEQSIRRFGNIAIFLLFLQGSLWGIAWLTFIPVEDPIYLVLAATWMIGISAAPVSAYSVYTKALLAFFVPVVFPGTIHLLIIGGPYGTPLGLTLILYSVVVLRAVSPVNKSMTDAIRLNFELEEEIDERKKIEEKLREISVVDGLTGLYNRRHFDEILEAELRTAQRISVPISLIMIDIDYFKAFNDTYGHLDGDTCLQRVCLAIDEATKRPGDLTFRYGGEEIAVVLPNTNSSSAYVITEAMRKAVLDLNIPHEGSQLDAISAVTISAGVVTIIPDRDTKVSDLIQLADDALYQAKGDGRNCIVASAVDELIVR